MDAAAELGRNPLVSTRFSLSMEMSRLTRDGTAEPVSRDQIIRRERGQGSLHFPCPADHVQDWQPYPVDPYSCYMFDHTYILSIPYKLTVPVRHAGVLSSYYVQYCFCYLIYLILSCSPVKAKACVSLCSPLPRSTRAIVMVFLAAVT